MGRKLMTDHLVQFSGGIGSWMTARRIRDKIMRRGDTLSLLFADTMMEDEDLYRFLEDAADDVKGDLIQIRDGRDVWQVFKDEKFIGNTLVDPCSRRLKRELLRKWIEDNREPEDTIIYLGIDWTEIHRYERAVPRWEPWTLRAPMCEKPLLDKAAMLDALADRFIEPPRLYALGFPHNNCGGFCVKAGAGQFALLYHTMPERFAYHEQREQEVREYIGADVAILRRRAGGVTRPQTLRELRERIERGEKVGRDMGGCGCAID